jgi:hypothetical protein
MRTATKKFIAGLAVLACLLAVVASAAHRVAPIAVLERAIVATVVFAGAGFIGGLIYEKLWLK